MTPLLTIALLVTCGDDPLRVATEKGINRVTLADTHWQKNKTCFSCHHQPLPMLARISAAKVGIANDETWMKAQTEFTHDYFKDRIDTMNAGKHVPGGTATVAFGLWTFAQAKHVPDKTTTAMVEYLLKVQGVVRVDDFAKENADKTLPAKVEGTWLPSCNRPPLNSSRVGNTVLAMMGVKHFATQDQKARADSAFTATVKYLNEVKLVTTEDYVWRLWGLQQWKGDDLKLKQVKDSLRKLQRDDGGWAQTKDMASDAYATGQALYVLRQCDVPKQDEALIKAVAYLLKTQASDGSWKVETQAKAVQPYFDNGDPYEKHQFLSVAATAWATAALAEMVKEKE